MIDSRHDAKTCRTETLRIPAGTGKQIQHGNPADHSEVKRERWTATVTYVFQEKVKNNELAVNPLGLTIVRFRADQAFS
jgi:type IV secretory pathway component VirB8